MNTTTGTRCRGNVRRVDVAKAGAAQHGVGGAAIGGRLAHASRYPMAARLDGWVRDQALADRDAGERRLDEEALDFARRRIVRT